MGGPDYARLTYLGILIAVILGSVPVSDTHLPLPTIDSVSHSRVSASLH